MIEPTLLLAWTSSSCTREGAGLPKEMRPGKWSAAIGELRRGCSGTGRAARAGYVVQRWLSNRVSRKPDDIPSRGLLQRLARAAPRDDDTVRLLWSSANRLERHVSVCAHVLHVHVCGHYMFTSSGVRTAAAGLEAAEGRLRSAGGWEAAAENLGPTEGLETAAAYEMDLTTAGEAAAQQGSGSTKGDATVGAAPAGSGAGAGAATLDAAAVVAAALDAAATSDAGSTAFERIASASAWFSMKRAPSASTVLTRPVRPWSMTRLVLEWAHASA
eukprot:scaffold1708_cov51-Phaeocystis_antarctica.AAC.3